ncbi:hypothetical protein Enr8_16560 [Blastopirellula retiformator]|uniref:Uncharacterized protein n=1 Tax=Blastopirellula retiformator TaxID=2527970 RepID=A0A5C5V972_9BACT|nr:hypothetical protein Enr8_16560 [Blastopirellula retiformator]
MKLRFGAAATSLNAASGKIDGKALRPVIATAGRIDARRATELGQIANQRILEQAAIDQIGQQRRIGLIVHRRDDLFLALDRGERLRAMDVPGDLVEDGQEGVNRDEADARFDQSPREQTALPEAIHPVALTHPGRRLARNRDGSYRRK